MGRGLMTHINIDRMARAIIVSQHGQMGLAVFEPVERGHPKYQRASVVFEEKATEARKSALAAFEAIDITEEMAQAGYEAMEKANGRNSPQPVGGMKAAFYAMMKVVRDG